MSDQTDPRKLIAEFWQSIDDFDDQEPMTSAARETFRQEIVPRTKRLIEIALDRDDVDGVRMLLRLSREWCNFAMDNGHAAMDNVGDPKQREELPAQERDWRP